MMDVPYSRSSQSEAEQKKCSIAHLLLLVNLHVGVSQATRVHRVEACFGDTSALTRAKLMAMATN